MRVNTATRNEMGLLSNSEQLKDSQRSQMSTSRLDGPYAWLVELRIRTSSATFSLAVVSRGALRLDGEDSSFSGTFERV